MKMANYGAGATKRQKTAEVVREVASSQRNFVSEFNESFSGINKIEYCPDGSIDETLKYRFYNASERLQGRTLEEWLRPAVSLRSVLGLIGSSNNGESVIQGPWNDQPESTDNQKRKFRAAFELFLKLGVKQFTVKDSDLLWSGKDVVDENQATLEEILDYLQELQNRTGLKLLSFTVDFRSRSRFESGALTTTEAQIASYVGARLKRGLDTAQRLNAENFIIRGENETFNWILNTDVTKEIRHYSYFLKMTADYKKRIGYRGQLLLEPTNVRGEQTLGYTRDAFSSQTFLRQYGLERFYKLNLPADSDAAVYSVFGLLGSAVVRRYGLPDLREATIFMKSTIEQGGLQPGGLNLCLKPWRRSTEPKDLFVLYINTLDVYARALRIAVKINTDGLLTKNVRLRYATFNAGWGNRFASGEASLESCEEEYRRTGQPVQTSARTEHWETLFNRYLSL